MGAFRQRRALTEAGRMPIVPPPGVGSRTPTR